MNITRFLSFIALILLLSGCSLLEVKLDSQSTPLTTQELNIRLLTREYSAVFFKHVEETADDIATKNTDNDDVYTFAILWKIYAHEGLQQSAYQISPFAGLIDSWVFTRQMEMYFTSGDGNTLFGTEQTIAVNTSHQLAIEIEKLAKRVLKPQQFKQSRTFVNNFVTNHPFDSNSFARTPAFNDWLSYNKIDESEAITTIGTMPEALGDLSDRLSNLSSLSPKLLTWKAELLARNSQIDSEQLSRTLENINQSSLKFQDFVVNNPEYMKVLAAEMGKVLQPLLDDFDKKADTKLGVISQERLALEVMVERERIAIGEMVTVERANITKDLDVIAQNVVQRAIEQLTIMLSDILVYLILFSLVIFFAPFGLGFLMGKRYQRPVKIKQA
ncbi:chemotaxis protein [Photobacterium swingsii]|uniref:Chemotaxis protein n=1 Tax=Photobacterium swingsii TaxID=680026 RepID=A0A2T3P8N9_9GAMM|nr:chemotaxis protein [Photobacterium swingsii]PSW25123.1 chemotaxis protein [Photobacterium swingsii]